MPNPKPIVAVARPVVQRGPFWDRPAKVEAAVMLGLAAADMTQTCRDLTHPGWHETNLTQSCAKDVALTAAFEAAAVGAAWVLVRTGHRRLARLPMAYLAQASARGIIYTKEHTR